MRKNNQFAELSHETTKRVSETIRELQRVAITTEERVRQRIRSSVRIAIASALFCISGIVSLGVNVGVALAHKGGYQEDRHQSSAARRKAKHHKHRHWKHLTSDKLAIGSDMNEVAQSIGKEALTGKASWYGGKFQHRKTASGNTFDTHLMTAAHRTLPFGTKVRVTNTSNHKSCIVEITDRGPYIGSRIIDLSYAAASKLGFANLGTATVDIEVIGSLAEQLTAQAVSSIADLSSDASLVAAGH